mmetsp:Transcript_56761/g.113978  ORF Transcript_56761/g.113978 Transcript_56761/m.113978 type:complete len:175 (+) Transcript_56761:89-613(+)
MGNAGSSSSPAGEPTNESLPDIVFSELSETYISEVTLKVKIHYDVPIAFLAWESSAGTYLKGRHGIDTQFVETGGICHQEAWRELPVIQSNILQVPHTKDDPLVVGPPHARFYVGAPLLVPGSTSIGTLCIMDTKPYEFFSLQRCSYLIECSNSACTGGFFRVRASISAVQPFG